ncbi:ferritin-like domain-containing protein [Thiocapsa rosea]|uniref:Rubrerythrin n=1 Tax=Thiocapsa rosea TaxID=69360 RepID=A0A495VA98_9GAMM|nr:ferritin family protein [Thiocapsa rosea]RKT45297.1 rubrerythrin [Thiocapsa rosea]
MSTPSSTPSTQRIESVAEFLVHALELEHESAERYRQLAESMTVHHNHTVAAVFRLLADMSAAHASEVTARAEGLRLPEIAPWDFKWACPGSPEVDCDDFDVSYLMTPLQALELALFNEIRGRDFYAFVATDSPQPRVRALAAEMAAEENEHVELVATWVERERLAPTRTPEDLDPPNQLG